MVIDDIQRTNVQSSTKKILANWKHKGKVYIYNDSRSKKSKVAYIVDYRYVKNMEEINNFLKLAVAKSFAINKDDKSNVNFL
jgi:hypothetical protein